MIKKVKLLFEHLQTIITGWINTALNGTYNHFQCFFSKNPGCLSSAALRFFFSGIKLDKDQTELIKKIPDSSIIIYANKYKSYFEYLFFHT